MLAVTPVLTRSSKVEVCTHRPTGSDCIILIADKILGPNPATARGAALHVYAHPREPKIIYPSGKYVVVKSLVDPSDCFVYRSHSHPVTVAKFSPNGYWVASGGLICILFNFPIAHHHDFPPTDTSGKVRVWSWDNPEHMTKLETPVFSGEIKDLDWDFESKKICAVGDGSGMVSCVTCLSCYSPDELCLQMAKVFTWDTGNSVGEMVGHNKRILSVAFKQSRPFRIFTASEDMRTIIYAGPPFKLQKSFSDVHSNFVNCIRYAPNGSCVVSVGSDKKIQFYDGTTGEPNGDIADAHAGSIYSVAFSPDSAKILTASADKTVKLWDVATKACEATYAFSADSQLGDMQNSVLWAGDFMVTVSLNGNINILNPADPSAPSRVIQGHQLAITAMTYDRASDTIYTGSFEGVLAATPLSSGITTRIKGSDKRNINGAVHSGKLTGMAVSAGSLVSVGWDDTLRVSDTASLSATPILESLNGQPCGMAVARDQDVLVVVTNQEIAVYRGADRVKAVTFGNLGFGATCVAVNASATEIAVGGDDFKTHIYRLADAIEPVTTISTRSAVSVLAYSPVDDALAIGDNGRQVEVYDRESWTARVQGRWVNHTSRVTAMAWSPSGNFLATGSTDESIIIWNPAKNVSYHIIPYAHQTGVAGVAWTGEDKLVSAGGDHCIVTWNVGSVLADLSK